MLCMDSTQITIILNPLSTCIQEFGAKQHLIFAYIIYTCVITFQFNSISSTIQITTTEWHNYINYNSMQHKLYHNCTSIILYSCFTTITQQSLPRRLWTGLSASPLGLNSTQETPPKLNSRSRSHNPHNYQTGSVREASGLARRGELPEATREAKGIARYGELPGATREAKGTARRGELPEQLARRGSPLAVASDEFRCGQNYILFKNPTIHMVLSLLLIPEFILNIFYGLGTLPASIKPIPTVNSSIYKVLT